MAFDNEKSGGNCRTSQKFSRVHQAMDLCWLNDLGYEGHPFTWTSGRLDNENIQCRLGRSLASNIFINRFSPIKVSHLACFGSDHASIKIKLEVDVGNRERKSVRLFRFEEVWSKDPRCEKL